MFPQALDLHVAPRVAAAVAKAAIENGVATVDLDPREVDERCRDLVYEGLLAV